MKFDANLERVVMLAALLEETMDPSEFSVAMLQLEAHPASMESLMAMQYIQDALRGNSTPDLGYTQAIMAFIAKSQAQRTTVENDDK